MIQTGTEPDWMLRVLLQRRRSGLVELDEASGGIINSQVSVLCKDFADGCHFRWCKTMFGEMEEFGGEFDWADEAVKTLGDLGMLSKWKPRAGLKNCLGTKTLIFGSTFRMLRVQKIRSRLLDNTISQMQEYKGFSGSGFFSGG